MSFFTYARKGLAVVGGLYFAAVVLLTVPYIQSHVLYLNAVKVPFFADFNAPETYALAPNKTYNVKIETPDHETLGAWFIVSDRSYRSLPPSSTAEQNIRAAIKQHPTILFLHGNAATRAYHVRVQHYKDYTSRFGANVLAIDYRGFADSTGTPSEPGLVTDARAAWDWLAAHGASPKDVLIIGHSLGTGVGGNLAAMLSQEKIDYRGVVLMSPFSSIGELLKTYQILGFFPLMSPLSMVPFLSNLVTMALIHKFDTLSAVPRITGEVVIAHAQNDWEIPYSHSEVLFTAFIDPVLPAVNFTVTPGSGLDGVEYQALQAKVEERRVAKASLVATTELKHFGTIEEAVVKGRTVTFVKALNGHHDYVGVQEGVQDVIGKRFGLL